MQILCESIINNKDNQWEIIEDFANTLINVTRKMKQILSKTFGYDSEYDDSDDDQYQELTDNLSVITAKSLITRKSEFDVSCLRTFYNIYDGAVYKLNIIRNKIQKDNNRAKSNEQILELVNAIQAIEIQKNVVIHPAIEWNIKTSHKLYSGTIQNYINILKSTIQNINIPEEYKKMPEYTQIFENIDNFEDNYIPSDIKYVLEYV